MSYQIAAPTKEDNHIFQALTAIGRLPEHENDPAFVAYDALTESARRATRSSANLPLLYAVFSGSVAAQVRNRINDAHERKHELNRGSVY